jgi:hypothetical protein
MIIWEHLSLATSLHLDLYILRLHRLAASGLVGTAWTEAAGARVVEGTGTPTAATIREAFESALEFSLICRFPYY